MNEKELPEWIEEKENGNYVVSTKDGKFELADIEYEKLEKAHQRISRSDSEGKKFRKVLISESLVEPKMGEAEIGKLHSSTVIRLIYTINIMYDLSSFL